MSNFVWEILDHNSESFFFDIDAVDTIACNHMAAVFYYTDSINTVSPAFAYPCSNYSDFVNGLCTSCDSKGNRCQQTGYRASSDRTLGTLYMMTLHGVKAPHFGMRNIVSKQQKPFHMSLCSRFSFRSDTSLRYEHWKTSTWYFYHQIQ